jgi:hypothetical protein
MAIGNISKIKQFWWQMGCPINRGKATVALGLIIMFGLQAHAANRIGFALKSETMAADKRNAASEIVGIQSEAGIRESFFPVSNKRADQKAQSRSKSKSSVDEEVIARRLRIERILMTLDVIAETAMQMDPVQSAQLEPVLVDLVEQTLALVPEEAVVQSKTDKQLDEIEATIDKLVLTLEGMVEPEMSI